MNGSVRHPSFDSWRLSRIDEELERLSFSSDNSTADDRSRSREGTLERRCFAAAAAAYPPVDRSASVPSASTDVYSKVEINVPNNSTEMEENARDALRYIKEKYDSLGKVKVNKPQIANVDQSFQGLEQSLQGREQSLQGREQSLQGREQSFQGRERFLQGRLPDEVEEHSVVVLDDSAIASLSKQMKYCQTSGDPILNGFREPSNNVVRYSSEFRDKQPQKQQQTSPQESALTTESSLPAQTGITEQEILQIEMFYRSHKTEVYVSSCMASLFISTPIASNCTRSRSSNGAANQTPCPDVEPDYWTPIKYGLPVLILDSGESRRQRRLHVLLAERGTGFCIWQDRLDHLSEYNARTPQFHVLHLSNDHSRLAGFRFDDPSSASDFLQSFRRLTADGKDPVLDVGNGRKKKTKPPKNESKKSKEKPAAIKKSDISQPCCFTHITKLKDRESRSATNLTTHFSF